MGSTNRLFSAAVLAVVLVALCATQPLFAQDNFKQLRQDVAELDKKLGEADKALETADAKVRDNTAAQAKAQGDKLKALKAEGVALVNEAAKARDARDKARSTLASKQGELRAAASKHAADQLSAAGDVAVRLQELLKTLDTWRTTLGPLPAVPALRDTRDLDPEAKRAILDGDRARLDEFDKWAEGEESRLKTEIERADKLVGAEQQVKGTDNGPEMVTQAKALKETLKTRQKTVGDARKQAAELKKKLK